MESISKKTKLVLLLISIGIVSLGANYTYGPQDGTGDIQIISPSGYVRIEKGDILALRWLNYSYSSRSISRIKVELCRGDVPVATLVEEVVNSGKYDVKIPDNIESGIYRIKLTSIDGLAYAYSDKFTVIDKVPINVISPTADVVWEKGKSYSIKWKTLTSHPDAKVYISLFRKGEKGNLVSVLRISDDINNTGEVRFTVPSELSPGTYMIGIRVTTIGEMKYSLPFQIK